MLTYGKAPVEREQLKIEEKVYNRHLQSFRKIRMQSSNRAGAGGSAMEKKVGLWIQIMAIKRVSV